MNEEFLSIKDENKFNAQQKTEPVEQEIKQQKHKTNVAPPKEGRSSETKLLITTLVLFFVALNVWGYYFYQKGLFGIRADINATPTPSPSSGLEKPDSIFMLPQK